jgi:hypothetical protein
MIITPGIGRPLRGNGGALVTRAKRRKSPLWRFTEIGSIRNQIVRQREREVEFKLSNALILRQ